MARIGCFGVGNMGDSMAANLVKAGHQVTVFDLWSRAMAAAVPKLLPGRRVAWTLLACRWSVVPSVLRVVISKRR